MKLKDIVNAALELTKIESEFKKQDNLFKIENTFNKYFKLKGPRKKK